MWEFLNINESFHLIGFDYTPSFTSYHSSTPQKTNMTMENEPLKMYIYIEYILWKIVILHCHLSLLGWWKHLLSTFVSLRKSTVVRGFQPPCRDLRSKPDRAVNPGMPELQVPWKVWKKSSTVSKRIHEFWTKPPMLKQRRWEISWPRMKNYTWPSCHKKICQICRAPKSSQFFHIRLTGGHRISSAMFTSDKGLDFRKDSRT